MELYDLALRLAETYYTTPPGQRLGLLSDWINQARAEPGLLREVLSNRTLFYPCKETETRRFFRRDPDYPTITDVANRFCLRFWGFGVVDVVLNRCPEPPTGEVLEEVLPLAA